MVKYVVKILCGEAKGAILAEGKYLTAVNIYNPTDDIVRITKRVVRSTREEEKPIPPSSRKTTSISPGFAIEIDCPDLRTLANIPESDFLKGFLVIESNSKLDIRAVYTYITSEGASLQVLPIRSE